TASAAATPSSVERQPRVTPAASTIVSASTNSTAEARKLATNTNGPLIRLDPSLCRVCHHAASMIHHGGTEVLLSALRVSVSPWCIRLHESFGLGGLPCSTIVPPDEHRSMLFFSLFA